MLAQTSLPNEERSVALQVETHEAAWSPDAASGRRTQLLWMASGFAYYGMLIGLAYALVLPSSHASANPSPLAHEVASFHFAPMSSLPQAQLNQLENRLPAPTMSAEAARKSWASIGQKAAALGLAGALAAANPDMTHAAVYAPPAVEQQAAVYASPAVVQQYGSSMIAASDDDMVSDKQREFLEQRKKMAQKYDQQESESTYKSSGEVKDKKSIYTTIVIGLIVVAFVAPMIQFFYYTRGD